MSADALSPPIAPECRDGDPALELGDTLVGTPQAPAAFESTHSHSDLRRLQPGHHRSHALGIRIGAVCEQRAVQGHKLARGLRAVAEQRFAGGSCA